MSTHILSGLFPLEELQGCPAASALIFLTQVLHPGGLGKRRQGGQGAELLPLNSLPTQPANSGPKVASLLSRVTASMLPGKSSTSGKETGPRTGIEV